MLVFCLVNFIHHHVDYFIMSVFCLVNYHDSAVLPWLLEDTIMLITLGCILKSVPKHLRGLCVFVVVLMLQYFFFEEWHQESQAVQGKLKRRLMLACPISQEG
jgi:hypothetical protein